MKGEPILYRTDDGPAHVRLRAAGGSARPTQAEITALFAATKRNVGLHVRNILNDGRSAGHAVVNESSTTAAADDNRPLEDVHNPAERKEEAP